MAINLWRVFFLSAAIVVLLDLNGPSFADEIENCRADFKAKVYNEAS
jgi:hypothetical protein